MLTIMGGIAEFERGLIRKRTDEGFERAKKHQALCHMIGSLLDE
jgi:DNA invertase Pin-like site-specific DNA recombinase